jgi:hypothetical protein
VDLHGKARNYGSEKPNQISRKGKGKDFLNRRGGIEDGLE